MNIADLVIIVILVWGAIRGYRRGLIGGLAGLISSIISFFVALKYYTLLATWANLNYNLQTSVQKYLQSHLVLPPAIRQVKLDTPLSGLGSFLDKVSLPGTLKTQLVAYIQSLETGVQAQPILGDIIQQFLATVIVKALAFLIIWLGTYMIIMLVVAIFQKATDNSLIASLDHGGGLLFGLALKGFILTIISGLFSPLLQITNLAEPTLFSTVIKSLGNSQLLPYFLSAFDFLTAKITAFWL